MMADLTAVKSRVGTPLNSWILRSTAYGVLSMYIGTLCVTVLWWEHGVQGRMALSTKD